jgi:hypothetical protein
MRNIFLLIVIAAIGFMVACDDHDTLPPYTTSNIFVVTSVMTQVRDTILSGGDTIKIKANGFISDTTKKYSISCAIKATDTTTSLNLISGNYSKSVNVKFDTVGSSANNNMFHWYTDTIRTAVYIPNAFMPIPAIPAKTKIRTTAVFTYGLNLSSRTGNTTATSKNYVYAK